MGEGYVTNRYHNTSSVSDMLADLEWSPLETRRKFQRLTMFYKNHNNLVAIKKDQFITPTTRVHLLQE